MSDEHVAELHIGDSRAAVHYRLEAGKVVVARITNADFGNPIQVTTIGGSTFDLLAHACAMAIETQLRTAAAA
jgi:hypothetical protein